MVCIRPIQFREYHCTTCQRCTPQYDHHCFWINNCVGKNNILRFNIFLVVSEACLCWVTYLSVRLFIILQLGDDAISMFSINQWVMESPFDLIAKVACAIIWAVFLFLAFPMLCLILVQQKNLLLGKTTY